MSNIATRFWLKWRGILVALAILTTAINVWQYTNFNRIGNNARDCEAYRQISLNNELVVRSMRRWSVVSNEPIESMRRHGNPDIIDFSDRTCVALDFFGLGGAPVYCYDNKNKKMVFKKEDVE